MSPLLQILMDETDCPIDTEEFQSLKREIAAYFERGFSVCAQLFAEILSKYSS